MALSSTIILKEFIYFCFCVWLTSLQNQRNCFCLQHNSLDGFDLDGLNLDGFDLDGLDLDGLDLDGFDLDGLDLDGFDLYQVTFSTFR